jgi:hypothetical protein
VSEWPANRHTAHGLCSRRNFTPPESATRTGMTRMHYQRLRIRIVQETRTSRHAAAAAPPGPTDRAARTTRSACPLLRLGPRACGDSSTAAAATRRAASSREESEDSTPLCLGLESASYHLERPGALTNRGTVCAQTATNRRSPAPSFSRQLTFYRAAVAAGRP